MLLMRIYQFEDDKCEVSIGILMIFEKMREEWRILMLMN